MNTMENYEDFKNLGKSFLQVVTSNNFYYAIFLFVIMVVVARMMGRLFRKVRKKSGILMNFLLGCVQVVWVSAMIMKICSLSPVLTQFTTQILMSSSLIVVVLGFVFQEGLSNIVHGFIISLFNPFHIGDRVRIIIDGEQITGYIKSVDLRSTIIQNVMNSSHVIVPNSKMDMCVIENSYFDAKAASTNFIDLSVTYNSNLEKVTAIVSQEIAGHPHVDASRKRHNITEPVMVMIRALEESGIAIRATVMTDTVEENFAACSAIRYRLVERFNEEPDIDFAYPHVEVVQGKIQEKT